MQGFPALVTVVVAASVAASVAEAQTADWTSEVGNYRSFDPYTEDPAAIRAGGYGRSAWAGWVTPADMPQDLRTRSFRTVSYLGLEVAPNGKVTACRVVKPSSDPRLDVIACRKLLALGQFDPIFAGPGRGVGDRFNFMIHWSTESRAEVAARRPMMAAPAPPGPIDYNKERNFRDWPRRQWEGGLRIDRFPDLQAIWRGLRGRRAIGDTSLDLTVDSAGATACQVGVGSGDLQLDTLACDTARALPLSYDQSCTDCGTRLIPLKFVWRRKGSFIAVPVASGKYFGVRDQIARDPADKRPPVPTGRYYNRIEWGSVSSADFADVRDKANAVANATFRLTLAPDGRISACAPIVSTGSAAVDARYCKLMTARLRIQAAVDVFGVESTFVELGFNLKDADR